MRGWLAPWVPQHEPHRGDVTWTAFRRDQSRLIDDAVRDELGWRAASADDATVGYLHTAFLRAHPEHARLDGRQCPCHLPAQPALFVGGG